MNIYRHVMRRDRTITLAVVLFLLVAIALSIVASQKHFFPASAAIDNPALLNDPEVVQ